MTRRDQGQATVELALALPFVCLLVCGLVQVAVIARDQMGVQLAAREAARAAVISADIRAAAVRAAEQSVRLRPLDVALAEAEGFITVRVRFVEHTDVPLIGMLLPDVVVSAEVTMAVEPP